MGGVGPSLYSFMSDVLGLYLACGLPLGWLSGSGSLGFQGGWGWGIYVSTIEVDFVSGLTLWLSLAELPAGAIPSLFSFIYSPIW